MKVTVFSTWYNEADLAPYFLENYSWADEVIILLDEATTDLSRELAYAFPNVRIEPCATPGGLIDDGYLVDLKNHWAKHIDADWIISVDADELIVPPADGDIKRLLASADGNLIHLHLWQVWRNEVEDELNPLKPAIWQRRHGDPNRTTGENAIYRKPIIFKPETQIHWYPGQHRYHRNPRIKPSHYVFDGAHWSMADEDIAVRRQDCGTKETLERGQLCEPLGLSMV